VSGTRQQASPWAAGQQQGDGLDQIPKSLLPLLACRDVLCLTTNDIISALALFVGEIVLSRLLFDLHLRDRPY
jgi:CDP-2,3-bis-(O-geranylgeranyl)-sn-glycerol synthase